jgi:acetate kinase
MNAKRAVLAAAAAALFTAGIGAGAAQAADENTETVKCQGVNACKGHSDCATAKNDCSGKNSCRGKGWKKMTAEECEKAKAAK